MFNRNKAFKSTINRNLIKTSKAEREIVIFPFLSIGILLITDIIIQIFTNNTLNQNLYNLIEFYLFIIAFKTLIFPNYMELLYIDYEMHKVLKNEFERQAERFEKYEKLPKAELVAHNGTTEISLIKNGNISISEFDNMINKFEQITNKILVAEHDTTETYTLIFKTEPEPLNFGSKSLAKARYYQLDSDVESGLKWDVEEDPHLLLVASTGQGKSVFLRWLINQISSTDSIINMIDIKSELGNNTIAKLENYGTELYKCAGLIRRELEHMQERIKGTESRDVQRYLILEEFQSFSTQLEMANSKEYKKMIEQIQTLLITARSMNMSIIMVCQDGSTETIPSKIRNNMSFKMYLGRPTKEQAVQLFGTGAKELPKLPNIKGAGYVKSNLSGSRIQKFITPRLD